MHVPDGRPAASSGGEEGGVGGSRTCSATAASRASDGGCASAQGRHPSPPGIASSDRQRVAHHTNCGHPRDRGQEALIAELVPCSKTPPDERAARGRADGWSSHPRHRARVLRHRHPRGCPLCPRAPRREPRALDRPLGAVLEAEAELRPLECDERRLASLRLGAAGRTRRGQLGRVADLPIWLCPGQEMGGSEYPQHLATRCRGLSADTSSGVSPLVSSTSGSVRRKLRQNGVASTEAPVLCGQSRLCRTANAQERRAVNDARHHLVVQEVRESNALHRDVALAVRRSESDEHLHGMVNEGADDDTCTPQPRHPMSLESGCGEVPRRPQCHNRTRANENPHSLECRRGVTREADRRDAEKDDRPSIMGGERGSKGRQAGSVNRERADS